MLKIHSLWSEVPWNYQQINSLLKELIKKILTNIHNCRWDLFWEIHESSKELSEQKHIFIPKVLERLWKRFYDCWKTILSPIHWKLWLVPKSMLHKCLTVRWSYPTRLLKMQKLDVVSTCHTVTMDLLRGVFGEHLFHLRNWSRLNCTI